MTDHHVTCGPAENREPKVVAERKREAPALPEHDFERQTKMQSMNRH